MNKVRQEEIIKLLTSKGAIQPCPRCTNPQFELLGEASIPVGEEKKGTILTGPYTPEIPVVVLACKNCGYVSYHAEGILDPRR